jgi:hypothetical protein
MDTQKNQLNDMMYLLKPPARDLPQPYEAPSAGMASRLMQKRGM